MPNGIYALNKSTYERRIKAFRLTTFLASLLTLAVGLVHVSSKLSKFCTDPESDEASLGCFGPWLIWQRDGSGIDDLNEHWRGIFSLNTSIVFDLWTPVFLGLVSIHMHIPALRDSTTEWEASQFMFNGFLYLFAALFGNFGYSGNLGVISGFINAFAAFLCFLSALTPQ